MVLDFPERAGEPVAQLIHSRIICGRFRVQTIEGVGRRKPRVIEIQVLDTGERLHGSARWLEQLVRELETRASTSLERMRNSPDYLLAPKPKCS